MEIVFLIIGIVVGGVIGYLVNRSQKPKGEIDTSNFEKKISSLETETLMVKNEKEEQKKEFEKQKAELAAELHAEREKLNAASTRLAKAEEAFKNQDEKLRTQKSEIEELQKRLTTEFKNIANEILEEKSKRFTEQNKTNMDSILNPLKLKIEDFEKKVENTYKAESTERITLKAEIKQLVELNKQVSDEANNLTRALKGDNKTQGNWGEVILEKILERSGLSKERGEYKTQETLENSNGETIRPDAIIYLPDNKHIVVDSKVSLIAYQNFVVAENEELRSAFLKEHVKSLKTHILSLSDKLYASSTVLNTPDFVLMFLPIESSFGVAVQSDQEIFSYAWDRKIVVVSPSTLLATLRTIAAIWKQELQTKNAMEIARQSGALYDKFVAFVEDLDNIGKRIDSTQKAYADARNKLEEGKGNLISRAEKIKDLGAKAGKSLPENLLDKENNQLGLHNE